MRRLLGSERLIVGYDLGDDYSQISYCVTGGDVETLSLVAGAENFNIPTVLCKRDGVNQWFYGKEAIRFAEENHGIMVKRLLSLAVDGEMVQIEGTAYDPVALLTLFIKRSLGLFSSIATPDKIDAFIITCDKIDHRMKEVLSQVVGGLKLKASQISFQSHTESFYHYMISQPEELWNQQVLLCDYRESSVKVYRMECNRRTKPIVVYIEKEEYPFLVYEPFPEEENLRNDRIERLDSEFLEFVTNVFDRLGNVIISSVYLIGENFSEEWMKESLRFLCRGRRVFLGSNLYSKGACYGMLERFSPSETGKSHVFLGSDKLKANVGMKILRRGEESYYALLDAGVNWYEAESTMECYLQDGNEIELTITPLIGHTGRTVSIVLDDFTANISRLQLHLFLQEENLMVAEIADLGFGEIRAGTERVYRQEIELY